MTISVFNCFLKSTLILLIAWFAILQASFQAKQYTKDYCDCKLCEDYPGDQVACDIGVGIRNTSYLWNFHSSCPNATKIGISDGTYTKMQIMKNVEKCRNRMANGRLGKPFNATRMGFVEYDEELAYLAEILLQQCHVGHYGTYDCANTDRFPNVGIATGEYYLKNLGFFPRVSDPIIWNKWCNTEMKKLKPELIRNFSYEATAPPNMAQNAATLIIDENDKIGCASAYFPTSTGKYRIFLICLFPTRPKSGQPLFDIGPVPASDCQTGTNPNYIYLCSKNETYNYN